MAENRFALSDQTRQQLPEKWQEKYALKRIDEEDLTITENERRAFLEAIKLNERYIQLGRYTIMINSIKSIEPFWGRDNIPPRPKPTHAYLNPENRPPDSDDEGKQWDLYFAHKQLDGGYDE